MFSSIISNQVRYFDGSVIMYALDARFYENYNMDNPKHNKLSALLFHIEDILIELGELPQDNAHIVCRKD